MLIKKKRGDFYIDPRFADFPKEEYDLRIERVRRHMEDRKIDILVLWDDHNIRYFSGFNSMHWAAKSIQPAVFLVPLENDPILIVPEFFRGEAEATSYAKDIRGQERPHNISSLRNFSSEIARVIAAIKCDKGRIGIEDGDIANMYIPRPISDIDLFRSDLRQATFVRAAEVIWLCRMIKSSLEVEALKTACKLTVEAVEEFIQNFQLGMSEKAAGMILYSAIVKRGLLMDGMYFVGHPDRYPMIDSHPSYDGVNLNSGHHIVIECGGIYKGYHGSVGHCFDIGTITDEKWELINAVNYGQDAALSAIKDGVRAKEIIFAVSEALADKGFKPTGFVGHGIGLTGHEPPDITDSQEMEIKKGMVFAIEVWIYDITNFTRGGRVNTEKENRCSNLGQFGMEELVLVTKDGYEMLPTIPRDCNIIP